MRDERRADLLADPLDDVEDAGREAGLLRRGRRAASTTSGDHSAGFRITVQPAASAGAVFQVESMNGAFHGVITTAGPLGIRMTRFAVPFDDQHALLVGDREIGVGAVVARAARDHARLQRAQQHRHVDALDLGETVDVRVDQVGEPVEIRRARPLGPSAAQAGKAACAAATAQSRLARSAARDLGERPLVDRARVDEALAARDPLAADEVVGRDRDAGDLRRGRRSQAPHGLEVVDRVARR